MDQSETKWGARNGNDVMLRVLIPKELMQALRVIARQEKTSVSQIARDKLKELEGASVQGTVAN
jgi:hypothetical protein